MPRLDEIARAQKELPSGLVWSDAAHDLRSRPRHEARVALSTEGIGLEGVFLRIWCPKTLNAYGFGLQLECQLESRRPVPIARMDWKDGHTNPSKGPVRLRLMDIPSTHVHSFDDNYIAAEDRMRSGNLPIAAPIIPDPENIPEFLAVAEELLRIRGLTKVKQPPYQGDLL